MQREFEQSTHVHRAGLPGQLCVGHLMSERQSTAVQCRAPDWIARPLLHVISETVATWRNSWQSLMCFSCLLFCWPALLAIFTLQLSFLRGGGDMLDVADFVRNTAVEETLVDTAEPWVFCAADEVGFFEQRGDSSDEVSCPEESDACPIAKSHPRQICCMVCLGFDDPLAVCGFSIQVPPSSHELHCISVHMFLLKPIALVRSPAGSFWILLIWTGLTDAQHKSQVTLGWSINSCRILASLRRTVDACTKVASLSVILFKHSKWI